MANNLKMSNIKGKIKVTIDKGHLLTLGERMYVESIELIRELVNNAYDADATEVYIKVASESIVVEDDGSGMNEKGFAQFFIVGSEEKKIHSVSPRFGRKRVGQFGIGKFAALAAAECFTIESRKNNWIYSVIFDRDEWQKSDGWELPITKEPATPLHHEGTKITLTKLKKQFNVADIERHLKDAVPLRAKKFSVYLNGSRISARFIPGKSFPIFIKTLFGEIEGEIILTAKSDLIDRAGVECRVRQVLIRRELFDLEKTHLFGLNRITGAVNADFLPIIGNREDFIRDSQEFKLFYQLMRAELEKILKELKKEIDLRRLKKIQEELKEALGKLRLALKLNPELTPSGRTITMRRKRKGDVAASTMKQDSGEKLTVESLEGAVEKAKLAKKIITVEETKEKVISLKPEVIKRIRLPQLGISVAVTPLGQGEAEVISDGNLIYINSDHPLYRLFYNHKDQFELHLLRLITQEVVSMKKLRLGAKEAFDWQSKLLTDAFCGGHVYKH